MTNTHTDVAAANAAALRAAHHLREARNALRDAAHLSAEGRGTDWNKATSAADMCEHFAELVRTIGK